VNCSTSTVGSDEVHPKPTPKSGFFEVGNLRCFLEAFVIVARKRSIDIAVNPNESCFDNRCIFRKRAPEILANYLKLDGLDKFTRNIDCCARRFNRYLKNIIDQFFRRPWSKGSAGALKWLLNCVECRGFTETFKP